MDNQRFVNLYIERLVASLNELNIKNIVLSTQNALLTEELNTVKNQFQNLIDSQQSKNEVSEREQTILLENEELKSKLNAMEAFREELIVSREELIKLQNELSELKSLSTPKVKK